jgi:hypothetical protein
MSQTTDFGQGKGVPGFAKMIMLLQMLVIVFLSSWIYEEYLNNIYLQSYVNDVIQADGSLIAILVIVSTLGLAVGLLKVLKSTHRQIGAIVNQPQAPMISAPVASSSKPALDLHPMVAALKAEMAHQTSIEALPQLDVKEAVPAPAPLQAPPNPAPVRASTGTPSTVITGTMPVLKRVNPEQDRNQNSRQ